MTTTAMTTTTMALTIATTMTSQTMATTMTMAAVPVDGGCSTMTETMQYNKRQSMVDSSLMSCVDDGSGCGSAAQQFATYWTGDQRHSHPPRGTSGNPACCHVILTVMYADYCHPIMKILPTCPVGGWLIASHLTVMMQGMHIWRLEHVSM